MLLEERASPQQPVMVGPLPKRQTRSRLHHSPLAAPLVAKAQAAGAEFAVPSRLRRRSWCRSWRRALRLVVQDCPHWPTTTNQRPPLFPLLPPPPPIPPQPHLPWRCNLPLRWRATDGCCCPAGPCRKISARQLDQGRLKATETVRVCASRNAAARSLARRFTG